AATGLGAGEIAAAVARLELLGYLCCGTTGRIERSPLAPLVRAARDFFAHRGPVRAASLSYTSLLALVPLLALVLSVTKGIVRNQDPQLLLAWIDRFLDYAVPQLQYLSADEMASARQDAFARLQEAINRIDAGALGGFGAVTLVTIGISLLSAIEHAFNDIWGVERGRPLARRVVYYWAGVTLGPIFLFLALGITGSNTVSSVLGHLPTAVLARIFWRILPFAILSAGLTLLYWTMPNTSVPSRAALWGGVTAGTLLQLNNLASAVYFSQVLSYSKVYGSLGAVPVMMVGLYLSWMIVLYGAEVAHAVASPTTEALPLPEGERARSTIVLEVARVVAATYLAGGGGLTRREVADALGMPAEWAGHALRTLCEAGLLAATESGGDEAAARYLPARPPHRIAVIDIIRAAPKADAETTRPAVSAEVAGFLSRGEAVERAELGRVTLEELARPKTGDEPSGVVSRNVKAEVR
ncbi:MAG: YhjD/YihY/BrkB family envelope integrity protein, partial [Candidatus Binatia bacterium]